MVGVGAFFLSAVAIGYNLMFGDLAQGDKKREKPVEKFDDLHSLIRMVGVVAVSRTLDGFSVTRQTKWLSLTEESFAIIIAVGLSFAVGFFVSYKNKKNNLLLAGLTYTLLGLTISLEYFARK